MFFSPSFFPVGEQIVAKTHFPIQYNLSNPACYQTEKKIRIRQGTGIERLTYPRDIKLTLVSIQHTVDNGYVNKLYTQIYSRLKKNVLISYPQIKPLKIKSLCL